jgi:hypothetical protein
MLTKIKKVLLGASLAISFISVSHAKSDWPSWSKVEDINNVFAEGRTACADGYSYDIVASTFKDEEKEAVANLANKTAGLALNFDRVTKDNENIAKYQLIIYSQGKKGKTKVEAKIGLKMDRQKIPVEVSEEDEAEHQEILKQGGFTKKDKSNFMDSVMAFLKDTALPFLKDNFVPFMKDQIIPVLKPIVEEQIKNIIARITGGGAEPAPEPVVVADNGSSNEPAPVEAQ